MNFVTITMVFVVIWWLIFFMALPWGMRRNTTDDPTVNDVGAPNRPLLIKKALVTSVIAVVLTVVFFYFGTLFEVRGIAN